MRNQIQFRVNECEPFDSEPFIVVENGWHDTGYFSLILFTTPEHLERLAGELREAQRRHQEYKASKEGRNGQQTQEVSRPPEQGAALESRTPLDCGTA